MDLSGVAQDVECLHGHRFCFLCLENAHRPASCSDVKMWLLREQDEGAFALVPLLNGVMVIDEESHLTAFCFCRRECKMAVSTH